MERYKGIKRHEVPPHVFAITDSAYRNMLGGKYLDPALTFPFRSTAAHTYGRWNARIINSLSFFLWSAISGRYQNSILQISKRNFFQS